MASPSLYKGLGWSSPQWGPQEAEPPVGARGAKPVESSVAFEAPAEEPNLTQVTDSFLQFI